jgi:hypothetical protein
MKKLKLDLDSLNVSSFTTQAVPEARGTVEARGLPTLGNEEKITIPHTDTGPSITYPDTWGTGPCTTAPSSDFPCYSEGCPSDIC